MKWMGIRTDAFEIMEDGSLQQICEPLPKRKSLAERFPTLDMKMINTICTFGASKPVKDESKYTIVYANGYHHPYCGPGNTPIGGIGVWWGPDDPR